MPLITFWFIPAMLFYSFAFKLNNMKTITAYFVSIAGIVGGIKRKVELVIIQLTNSKPFTALESIITGMAN